LIILFFFEEKVFEIVKKLLCNIYIYIAANLHRPKNIKALFASFERKGEEN